MIFNVSSQEISSTDRQNDFFCVDRFFIISDGIAALGRQMVGHHYFKGLATY